MDIITNNWYIVAITSCFSFFMTFFVKKLAFKVNAIDMPNKRKVHSVPMPRLGGLSIYIAFIIGLLLFGSISKQVIGIILGSVVIIGTGFVDDIKSIPAKYKFLLQIVGATIAVLYGELYFTNITLLGFEWIFPVWVNKIISIMFIVAIINAINLADGIDGLACGVGLIYFVTITILGTILNKFGGIDTMISLIMVGACLGFLIHNFPPAQIFMGDTGSMFLGYMISCVALIGYKVATITSIIIPIIILFVPILDTLFAIIRRIIKRESVATPDKEHIHHQLLNITSSPMKTVVWIYIINIIFSAISIFYVLGDDKIAIGIYVVVMLFFLFLVLKTNILFNHKRR